VRRADCRAEIRIGIRSREDGRSGRIRAAWLGALLALGLVALGGFPAVAGAEISDRGPVLSDEASEPEEQTLDLARFDGLWHRIEVEQDDDVRLSTIDWALEQLSWLLRTMVGKVLRQKTVPPSELHFVWEDGRLYEQRTLEDGEVQRRLVVPDGRMRPDADGIEIAWQASPSALRLDWIQQQARGSSVYRLAPGSSQPGQQDAAAAGAGRSGMLVEYEIQVTAVEDIRPVTFLAHFDRSRADRAKAERAPAGAPEDRPAAGSSPARTPDESLSP